ncbi:MAG: nuclear transport factor 2 family protein, partial [Novosphingobium sp.]|nr:nuclear transport factor 2 family protein [Novosphingobium sp.]
MTDAALTLEQRVAALEDLRAIEMLKYRYLRACDRQQPDVVRDCFLPEAIIDYDGFPVLDRESFVETYRKFGCLSHIVDMHHGQNPIVELTGPDSAKGWFDLFFYKLEEGDEPGLHLSAVAY